MSCPFARFNTIGVDLSKAHKSVHASQRKTLTAQMKEETWSAHRAIEKSPGVAALMGSSGASSTLERLDYIRFLIMLACIYVPLESSMLKADPDCLLDPDLVHKLGRTSALMQDIQAHMDELSGTRDASASEFALFLDISQESQHALQWERTMINDVLRNCFATLDRFDGRSSGRGSLTSEHISLLKDRQVAAVWPYMQRISKFDEQFSGRPIPDAPSYFHYDEGVSLTPTGSPTRQSSPISIEQKPAPRTDTSYTFSWLVTSASKMFRGTASDDPISTNISTNTSSVPFIAAHIYVRYMGDLSGGQHMAKRLSRLFPVDDAQGFAFYSFQHPATLKESLRAALDNLTVTESTSKELAQEATMAFTLNQGLLDSLVEVNL